MELKGKWYYVATVETGDKTTYVGNDDLKRKEIDLTYAVVNKTTSVIEFRDPMLPLALEMMAQLDERLDELMKEFDKPELTIVGEEHEGGLH